MMLNRRRPRLAPVVAVAAGWLVAGATAAMAATGGVMLSADAGLDGVTRPGRLTPVRIAIENSGTDIGGDLVVVAGRVRIARALTLPTPSRKRIELYIRVPSADIDRIHVAFVAEGREVRAVDAVVRFVPDETRFVLCVAPIATGGSDPRCTSTLDAAALPDSWRGYDAVDEFVWSAAAAAALTEGQNIAISRWKILRANDMAVGPAAPPSGSARVLSHTRILIAAYAALFLLLVVAAQVLARRPLSVYAAVVAIVAFASAAAIAQGRIGAAASIVLVDSTIVRAAEGVDDAFVSTRGVATFPAFGSFELRPAFDDGIVAAREEPAGSRFAEDGGSVLPGEFGKGQRIGFELEGFSPLPTVKVTRSAETMRIANVASSDLTDCELPAGVSPRRVALLRAGDTLSVQGSPDAEDTALTCRFRAAPPTLRGNRARVEHQGTAVLVYALGPGGGHRR